jgi:MYXO-CTERM domain-containing protein
MGILRSVYLASVLQFLLSSSSSAGEISAGPADYREKIRTLHAGDTLLLAPGTYSNLLVIDGLSGRSDAWIVIRGPASGEPAVFTADPGPCCNTVEISDSSYVAIENITIDGGGVDGAFGVSAKGGISNRVHHIRIENCTFLRHDASQSTVAISTKTPTWGWIIRRNRILGAGTGMYLGNSDGSSPFIGGIIEQNLIMDTLGYNIQIKWQKPRPAVEGMPTEPVSNLIRHNVFIKRDRPSPDGDRPNLLVGGFPETGPGSEDWHEIYGNWFFHNPREGLLQASGRVSIHDNIFVDSPVAAIVLQDHDLPLRAARVYNNTIFQVGTGISVSGTMDQGVHLRGNLVFANRGLSGTPTIEQDNMFLSVSEASGYVRNPTTQPGNMDFYPLPGKCTGTPLTLSIFSDDAEWDLDFNGMSKGTFTFRGAYAGEGDNPGWALAEEIKEVGGSDGGADGGDAGGDAEDAGDDAGDSGVDAGDPGVDAGADAGGDPASDGDTTTVGDESSKAKIGGGCSCAQGEASSDGWWLLGLVFLAWLRRVLSA